MSPRRSSRARTSQPTVSLRQNTNSSASSISSGRADHNARPSLKPPSPRSSVAARSQSSEDRDGSVKSQPRRTRSSHDDHNDDVAAVIDYENNEEDEEEVTRCICGSQEYPGLPVTNGGPARRSSKSDLTSTALAEDNTGWFIQCDTCKVWQHAGCVGIMDEATCPEEYFCEQCRKELHRVNLDSNGRKHSLYLPVQDSKSPKSSPEPKVKDNPKRPRDARAARIHAENLAQGRRSTMNSRDSAYDEAEQLRRAIEESKKETGGLGATTGSRKGKRSRSESEERQENAKRQRTASGSSSSQSKSRRQDAEPEDEVEKKDKHKNIRGAAARNHRNKEHRDREATRETERADTVGKRKGRTDRRRGEDSDPSPESPSRTASSRGANQTEAPFASTPLPDPPAPKPSHKKTGRPAARRGRVGRNQYTRDRDALTTDNPGANSPARSHNSQDGDGGTPHLNGHTTNGYSEPNGVGKPSKPRHMNPNRTTMNDMKRRVAGILEFISHTQVEMAGITEPSSTTKTSTSTNTPPSDTNAHEGGENGKDQEMELAKATNNALRDLDGMDEEAFAALSSLEMMEVLTRRLMRWQGEYGKWGEK